MKKLGFAVILLSVFIASCNSDKESDKYRIDAGFVPYPGIAWNDSSEKVIAKMEVFADQREYQYGFENREVRLLYKVRDAYKSSFWLFDFFDNKLLHVFYAYQSPDAVLNNMEFATIYSALELSDDDCWVNSSVIWEKINSNCKIVLVYPGGSFEFYGIQNMCLCVDYRPLIE